MSRKKPHKLMAIWLRASSWDRFLKLFAAVFIAALAAVYLFVLLVDPYNIVPFSLPLERRLMITNHRFVGAQIVRSKRFDSLIVGTSTSYLLDPAFLNAPFKAKFAHLSMPSMTYSGVMARPPSVKRK